MSASNALGRQWGDVVSQHPEMEEHGDAVHMLAHGTADDRYAETSSHTEHDLTYEHRNVPLRSIRHNPDPDNPRTDQARRGYYKALDNAPRGMTRDSQPHDVPPVLLVHRAGVYEVADGHHRVTAARGLSTANTHINAVVAKSPHKDRYGKGWAE